MIELKLNQDVYELDGNKDDFDALIKMLTKNHGQIFVRIPKKYTKNDVVQVRPENITSLVYVEGETNGRNTVGTKSDGEGTTETPKRRGRPSKA